MDKVHEQRSELLEILIDQVTTIRLPEDAEIIRGPEFGKAYLRIDGAKYCQAGDWGFQAVMVCYDHYKNVMAFRERQKARTEADEFDAALERVNII